MFSEATMVKARNAVASMYFGTCDVIEYQKTTVNKKTSFSEVTVLQGQPCRLSHKRLDTVEPTDTLGSGQSLRAVLFIDPSVTISPGSKIVVTQCGVTTAYTYSGAPAVYPTHQEIELDLFKGWS